MRGMTDSFDGTHSSGSADHIVAALGRIDRKVDEMRQRRMDDPETLGDKMAKSAVPTLAALAGGKIFQSVWNRALGRRGLDRHASGAQGLLLSVIFAAASAALGALITGLSTRATQSLVNRRHRR